MYIDLIFDYYSKLLYIPDGYIHDVKTLQHSFLNWVSQQSECIVLRPGNMVGYSYDENDFIEYINQVVLDNTTEKAYFVLKEKFRGKRKIYRLEF